MSALATSIIIPVHRGGRAFEHCLASVAAVVQPQDEIIVVADGDGDESWRIAERFGARVVMLPVNGGPAKARNLGAQTALGDVLFFVDADVTIPADSLLTIRSVFESEQDVAALIGSYDEEPGEKNFLSQFKNLFHHFVHQHGSSEASTFWGACGAIRREVFLKIGGFDETYARPSIEDIELGYRLKAKSYRIRMARDLQVKHLKRWDASSLVMTDLFDRAAPWTELIWNHFVRRKHRVTNDLNLGHSYRLSLITSYLLVVAAIGSFFTPWSLILALLLATFFGLLHVRLFQFFHAKRGVLFACRALPWRFAYDIYSGLGFCYGSWLFAHSSSRKIFSHAFARLDAVALGFGVGAAWAFAFCGATVFLVAKGGDIVGFHLGLLSQYFPGYTVTWSGSLVGLMYGMLVGFFFGFSFALVRNTALRFYLGSIKVRTLLAKVQSRNLSPPFGRE